MIEKFAYSVKEASEGLGISQATFRRQIIQGTITATRVGRRLLIEKSEIDRLLREGRQQERSTAAPSGSTGKAGD